MQDNLDPKNFRTLSEWYCAVFEAKLPIPTAVPAGIEAVMISINISFHEAFALLLKEEALTPFGSDYAFDPSGPARVAEKYRYEHRNKNRIYRFTPCRTCGTPIDMRGGFCHCIGVYSRGYRCTRCFEESGKPSVSTP